MTHEDPFFDTIERLLELTREDRIQWTTEHVVRKGRDGSRYVFTNRGSEIRIYSRDLDDSFPYVIEIGSEDATTVQSRIINHELDIVLDRLTPEAKLVADLFDAARASAVRTHLGNLVDGFD